MKDYQLLNNKKKLKKADTSFKQINWFQYD